MKASSRFHLLSAVAIVAALAITSYARALITVSWGTESEGRYFANASGTLLAQGSLVLLGAFDVTTDFPGNAGDYSYLSSHFTLLGTASIGDGGFNGVDGAFAAANVTTLTNTPLSYWAFNAATTNAATEWGIFSQAAGLWTTPGTVPNSLNTDIFDATTAHLGRLTQTLAITAMINTPRPVPDLAFRWLDTAIVGLLLVIGYCFRRRVSIC